MTKLKLGSTSKSGHTKSTVLLYGESGSGKTTWASTWPNPVFVVPTIGLGELQSLSDQDFPVITFESFKEMQEQLNLLGKAVLKDDLLCDTLVIDNLTTIQFMLQSDLKETSGKQKLEWDEWGKYTNILNEMLYTMHKAPPNIIWIAQSDVERISEDQALGDIFMSGKSAKKLYKNLPSLLLQATVVDKKKAGCDFYINLKSHSIWPCKVRVPKDKSKALPSRIGPDPTYDDLANLLDWPACAEIEGRTQR